MPSDFPRFASFILHLDRAVERAANVTALTSSLPGPVVVVPGTDGRTLTQADSDCYAAAMHRPRYPFRLAKSEIACFHSHRRAWQRIVDDGLDQALIVEDDIGIDPAPFATAFALARANSAGADFVRFPSNGRERPASVRAQADAARLFQPEFTRLGMQCQLVGRQAAEKLLQATESFDRPVDTMIQMTWVTGVMPLVVWPSGVSEISDRIGGSSVSMRRPLLAQLRHEFLRPLFRWQQRQYSRRNSPS